MMSSDTDMSQKLMLNQSVRILATFSTLNRDDQSKLYFDYPPARYPAFLNVLMDLCEGKKPEEAFKNLDANLINKLADQKIVKLDVTSKKPYVIALEKDSQANISVLARFKDKPYTRILVPIDSFPSGLAWLLKALKDKAPNLLSLSSGEIDQLKKFGALVEDQPPKKVFYPADDNTNIDWESKIDISERVYFQNKDESIPKPVLKLLDDKLPETPDSNIVWGCVSGSRLPFATIIPIEKTQRIITDPTERSNLKKVKEKKTYWKEKLDLARVNFKKQSFVSLDNIIDPTLQSSYQQHVRNLITHNYFGPLDDGQVKRRMGIHNESLTSSIHHRLAKLVSLITGEKLKASYSYLGCYLDGAILERHIDRPQCRYNLSVVFDMCDEDENPVHPWPIYLKNKNKTIPINLEIGGGLIYRGNELEHWRDALPRGHRAIVCFYHFVDEKFDGQLL